MRNIKLVIEYEGTKYTGWQLQKASKTVQGLIEDALEKIIGEHVRMYAAGRTDSGVHAIGQVANFRTKSKIESSSFQMALNSILPKDIVIKDAHEIDLNFNARRDAKSKIYVYKILNRKYNSAILRRFTWHIRDELSHKKMAKALKKLIGEHDFSTFRSARCGSKNAIRKIHNTSISKRGDVIKIKIEGTAFLRYMVRSIVGTVANVGKGVISIKEFEEIFLSRNRKRAGKTAPPHGLFLKEVKY